MGYQLVRPTVWFWFAQIAVLLVLFLLARSAARAPEPVWLGQTAPPIVGGQRSSAMVAHPSSHRAGQEKWRTCAKWVTRPSHGAGADVSLPCNIHKCAWYRHEERESLRKTTHLGGYVGYEGVRVPAAHLADGVFWCSGQV